MKKYLALLFVGMSAIAFANTEKLPNNLEQAVEAVAPEWHNMPKESDRHPLTFVNQPPMIPHSVKGYQVTKNTNQCLNCHGVESYRATGAPRISPTHFMDRDGNVEGDVSPRRYFCLQCHVEQADVKPIVENKFESTKAFGGK